MKINKKDLCALIIKGEKLKLSLKEGIMDKWKIKIYMTSADHCEIRNSSNEVVAEIVPRETAKQIVHEHNTYQELVEALENLLQDDCTNCIYNNDKDKCSLDSFNNFPCRIQEAQTTLKKARR